MARPVVRIAFLDVGQGDSIVLSIPSTGEALLIDCIDAEAAITYLQRQKIKLIRGLVITHLHADHYREAVQFLENCVKAAPSGCEGVWLNPLPPGGALSSYLKDDHSEGNGAKVSRRETLFRSWINWARINRPLVHQIDVAGGLPVDGELQDAIELLHPFTADFPESLKQGYNNTSLVLRVSGVSSSALLTGDIEPEGWKLLKNALGPGKTLYSSFLKMPHHGAWVKGNAEELLADVDPEIAVISVGTNGHSDYNHPNPEVLTALRNRGVRVLCTQATEQCSRKLAANSPAIAAALKTHANSLTTGHYHESSGCACAGTVVVELGAQAVLIQPAAGFHQNEIIGRFFETAQCRHHGGTTTS